MLHRISEYMLLDFLLSQSQSVYSVHSCDQFCLYIFVYTTMQYVFKECTGEEHPPGTKELLQMFNKNEENLKKCHNREMFCPDTVCRYM